MIDIDRICLGCMREKTTAGEKCPYCGFDVAEYEHEPRWLPLMHILNGRYMLGKVLGEGGFGITYIGIDLNLQSRVAIKEYFPVGLVSRETTGVTRTSVSPLTGEKGDIYDNGLRKFVEEAQGVSKFDSLDGIVTVRDFFFENATAYMVMEYLDGATFKAYLKEHGGRITAEQALKYVRPIIEALQKVHEAGMIHRDISPDNIVITKEGKVKLIDFGSARALTRDENQTFTIMLKHGYAPPEQYQTRGNQGPWTDVYGISATLYKMITGKVPPSAMDRYENDPLCSFAALGIQEPSYIEKVIRKGMSLQIQNRYQSMGELYADLYLKKEGSIKEPHSGGGHSEQGTFTNKQKILSAIIVGLIILVVGVVARQSSLFIKISWNESEQSAKQSENGKKKDGKTILDITEEKNKDTDEQPKAAEEPEESEDIENTKKNEDTDESSSNPKVADKDDEEEEEDTGFEGWKNVEESNGKDSSEYGSKTEFQTESEPAPIKEKVSLMASAPEWSDGNYQPIPVLTANATSTISQKNTNNSAMMLFDNRDDTTWQEGVDGYGIGEKVDFNFGDNNYYKVKYMGFKLGNWKNDKYYFGNSKPRTLTITFGDYSEQVTFNDVRETQWVEISPAESVNCMSITIDDIYAGTSWQDTCITEILLYAES